MCQLQRPLTLIPIPATRKNFAGLGAAVAWLRKLWSRIPQRIPSWGRFGSSCLSCLFCQSEDFCEVIFNLSVLTMLRGTFVTQGNHASFICSPKNFWMRSLKTYWMCGTLALKLAIGSLLKAEAVSQDGSSPLASHNTCYLRSHKSCESEVKVLVTQSCLTLCSPMDCVWLFAAPWTLQPQEPCQVPLSVEFSRQEYWSWLPFPSPGDLPNPGIKPGPSELQADFLYHLNHQRSQGVNPIYA